jgi:hypothetical protein
MGGTCRTHKGDENIELDLKENGCEGMAQDTVTNRIHFFFFQLASTVLTDLGLP